MSVPTTGPPNVPQMTPSMLGSMLHAAGSGVGGVPPDPPTYAASQQPSVYGGGTGGHRGGAGVPGVGVDPTTQLYSSYATPPPPPPSYVASRYMASMGGGQGAGGTGVTTGVPGRYPAATSSYMNSYSTLQPQHMQLVHHQQHTVIARSGLLFVHLRRGPTRLQRESYPNVFISQLRHGLVKGRVVVVGMFWSSKPRPP